MHDRIVTLDHVVSAFSRHQRTSFAGLVWVQLWTLAEKQTRALPMPLLVESLGRPKDTVRKAIGILAKLGLVVPIRSNEGTAARAFYIPPELSEADRKVLDDVWAGQVEIVSRSTTVRRQDTGALVDRRLEVATYAEQQARRDEVGVFFWSATESGGRSPSGQGAVHSTSRTLSMVQSGSASCWKRVAPHTNRTAWNRGLAVSTDPDRWVQAQRLHDETLRGAVSTGRRTCQYTHCRAWWPCGSRGSRGSGVGNALSCVGGEMAPLFSRPSFGWIRRSWCAWVVFPSG